LEFLSRFIYNHFLSEKQKHYLENKTTLNFNQCAANLVNYRTTKDPSAFTQSCNVKKKKDEEFQWLKEVNSQVLISTLMNLETAYGNFFRKKSKFPRFKSKKNKNSFNIPQHISLKEDNVVQIPKFKEGIIFLKHRELKGQIKNATISKNPSGKYYISILCVVEKPTKHKKTGKSIGIDLGIKDFI
jgi:putative transposase